MLAWIDRWGMVAALAWTLVAGVALAKFGRDAERRFFGGQLIAMSAGSSLGYAGGLSRRPPQ